MCTKEDTECGITVREGRIKFVKNLQYDETIVYKDIVKGNSKNCVSAIKESSFLCAESDEVHSTESSTLRRSDRVRRPLLS